LADRRSLIGRMRYAVRAARAAATRPQESAEYALERVSEWRDERRQPWPYETTEASEERVHGLIGCRWPCDERAGFDDVWKAALERLAARGLSVGRLAFGRWDDGDSRLCRLAWCLTRHLHPEHVVETGVGRGLTTCVLLEALAHNGAGHLWSIDLPPFRRGDSQETAAAVPTRLYERWTFLRGSSRRLLPRLVSDLGQIDVFVHDSMHTSRNMRFELEQVWPALGNGVALVDDVEKNGATGQFLQGHPEARAVISTAADGGVLIGCLAGGDGAVARE